MDPEVLALAGLRIDGRAPVDLRQLNHRFDAVPGADGSVYMEHGLNKLLVAVVGPAEPARKKGAGADFQAAEKCVITCRVQVGAYAGVERKERKTTDRRLQEMEKTLVSVLETMVVTSNYPKSEVQLVIQVLEADGSLLPAALNAACLALMSAGVAMVDMVVGVTVGFVRRDLCVDLNQYEISLGAAQLPVIVSARTEQIVHLQLDNRLSKEQLHQALQLAIDACRTIKSYLEVAIKEYMAEQAERRK